MDLTELQEKAKTDYGKAQKALQERFEREHAKLMDEYETIIKWLAQQNGQAASQPYQHSQSLKDTCRMIEEILPERGKFTIRELLARAEKLNSDIAGLSRSVITKALKELVEKGTLIIASAGRGRRATVYQIRS